MRLLPALGFVCFVTPALAAAPENPAALTPDSSNAKAITGPIILSKTKIVFANGESLDLRFLSEDQFGDQTFRIAGEDKPLQQGNSLCKAGDLPEFLSVMKLPAQKLLNLRFYQSDSGSDAVSPGANPCAVFNYTSPEMFQATADPVEMNPLGGALINGAPVDEGSATPLDAGNWEVDVAPNPLDDTKQVSVALEAESGANQYGKKPVFLARCRSNETEVYVVWEAYLGLDAIPVTIRIGDELATKERWSLSTDHEATFAPGWPGNLLKEMIRSDRLVMQVTPYGASPITAIFNTKGLDVAMRELAETCGWSY